MANEPIPSRAGIQSTLLAQARTRSRQATTAPIFLTSHAPEQDNSAHQAELFYMQKQIQAQTPMVVVLEDGEKVEGSIEWYDRDVIKIRGRQKTLVYKSAIKYMYKVGDQGQ